MDNMYILLRFILFFIIAMPVLIQDIFTLSVPLKQIFFGILLFIVLDLIFLVTKQSFLFFVNLFCALQASLVFFITRLVSHSRLGVGDIFLSFLCGYFCGFGAFYVSILLSCTFCLLCFFIFKYVAKKNIKERPLPFAPFLILGTILGKGFFQFFL